MEFSLVLVGVCVALLIAWIRGGPRDSSDHFPHGPLAIPLLGHVHLLVGKKPIESLFALKVNAIFYSFFFVCLFVYIKLIVLHCPNCTRIILLNNQYYSQTQLNKIILKNG